MTISGARRLLANALLEIYDEREAKKISEMVMEKLTGWSRTQLLLNADKNLDTAQIIQLEAWQSALLQGQPIQYVIEEAWFMGLPFAVREGVLIPRPETEELVQWILDTIGTNSGDVLDVGTGSGCIAIALSKLHPDLHVAALDISPDALAIARENNEKLHTNVTFLQQDMLDTKEDFFSEKWDVIVSNPPYITERERLEMHANVLDYEPEVALFVPNGDPLLFYRKIAEIASRSLCSRGYLFFEINEHFGKETVSLLSLLGFRDIILRKDLQGKDRMVKALWLVN
ncbi:MULTISPECIES: peptide chain release factor N(5)-glutamine methyltransferase [Chitinophagaceae]